MDRNLLKQIDKHLLQPIKKRIANVAARAVVQLVDDGRKLQLLQLGVLAGETIDSGEHHQAYGFSSVPLAGAEAVVVFPGGDRSHPLVVSVSDRRYRPTAGESGQVTIYHYKGAKITMLANGNVVMTPGPGGEVLIDDGAGDYEPVVKRSEFLSHGHPTAASGPVSPPVVAPATTPPVTFPGTTLFQSK